MALSVRHRPRSTRLALARLSVLFAGSFTHLMDVQSLHAATLTIRATIASSDQTLLPFPASIGDPVVASIPFTPRTTGSPYSESGEMRIDIGDTKGSLTGYQFAVHNDEFPGSPGGVRGIIADPLHAPISDMAPLVNDNIVIAPLTSVPLSGTLPGTVHDYGNLTFYPRFVLAFSDTVLSTDALLADPVAWNSFEFRELSIIVRNSLTGATSYIGAYVDSIQIPESDTSTLLFCGIGAVVFVRRVLGVSH